MADKIKIKITKDDIESGAVEMPDGYKIEKYKTKDELDAEMLVLADEIEASIGEAPDEKDLVEYAKLVHPYYQSLIEIAFLRKQLSL